MRERDELARNCGPVRCVATPLCDERIADPARLGAPVRPEVFVRVESPARLGAPVRPPPGINLVRFFGSKFGRPSPRAISARRASRRFVGRVSLLRVSTRVSVRRAGANFVERVSPDVRGARLSLVVIGRLARRGARSSRESLVRESKV